MRSGLCTNSNLGEFITTIPEGKTVDDTSIFTSALKFSATSFPSGDSSSGSSSSSIIDDSPTESSTADLPIETEFDQGGNADDEAEAEAEAWEDLLEGVERKRRDINGIIDGITGGITSDQEDGYDEGGDELPGVETQPYEGGYDDELPDETTQPIGGGYGDELDETPTSDSSGSSGTVTVYSALITYSVKKTGYYCVGESSPFSISPVLPVC